MKNISPQWHFINTGFHSGIFNMEYDEALAQKLQRGEIGPTVRIYGWNPWAISLGHNQKETDIDYQRCRKHGIEVVRRATGGRAILHANELTYSVVMFAEGRSITEIYSEISRALVTGLKTIHAGIEMELSQPHFPALYKKAESFPCFASSAKYEIQIDGKKLVGSAQRRLISQQYPEVVLQHGSILLGPEHKKLAEYFNSSSEEVAQKIQNDFEKKTIDLSTFLHRTVTFDEAGAAVFSGFEKEWGLILESTNEAVV